ncbi:MAG: uncharacterized protein JWP52_4586 [Rhizobacter sp.]|nr:uncharacterized protein [Rhizobacter sp.]
MPVFMIDRRYADDLELSADDADGVNRINSDEGVQWLYSFLSADKRKTYCLYEAPSAEAIRRAAARAGLPADVVVEMTATVRPDGSLPAMSGPAPGGPATPAVREPRRTSPPGTGTTSRPRSRTSARPHP